MKKKFLNSKIIKRNLILFYSLVFIFQMSFFSALPVNNYAAASGCQTGLNIEAQTEFRGQTSLGCINPWDKSSLEFASCCQATCEKVTARICNYGNGNMISSSSYEVWYSATGNPKFGSLVATGTIPVLGQGQCTDLEYIPTVVGNYKFKAYQQFGHFGVGYLWSDNCGVISFDGCIQPYCGDGTVNNGEECDDGNTIGGDGCSANCTVEQTGPYCGDGIKNGTEECDGNDGVGEHQACSVNCTLNNLPYCGDGIKNNSEECDGSDGVGENQICSDTCTITEFPYCGDGIINGDEECDDANTNSEDACQNNCTLPTVCESNLDVMMVLDRSGSMGDSSRCDWWQLKCNNRPVCTSYTWVLNTDYNKSKSWCDAKSQSFPHNSVWTDLTPTKISVAKETANNFLSLMGTGDQSGLVSFANSATLDKTLSNNHAQTQTAINNLIPYGATNIGDAIKLANGELTSIRINASATQIMILLTDGKANKPSGSGYGEYGSDVAYALAQANEAAVAGIKIFTIGLGADINADMLQQIASTTGGKYYFSPTAQDLDDIFALLKPAVCEEEFYCGDGIKNGTEECDGNDGVGENQICSDTCTITELPYCGDGIINGDEECDDANTNSEDACQNNCTLPTVCESNLDVMMVLDRSGSMGYDIPTRLSQAKIAANTFIEKLQIGDQSGLVSFANSATLDKTLSNNHAQTQTAINNLIPYGATNIGDAIKLANGELTSIRINASATQIMILLTDGKANKPSGSGYGEYGPDVAYALAQANEAAVAGIKIFTIGLGADINADMLQQIASTTGGKYYFSPTAQDLDDIFAQISTGVCQNLVRISSPYQVSSYGNIAIVLQKYLI